MADYDPFADPSKPAEKPEDKSGDVKPTEPTPDHTVAIEAANKRAADAEAKLVENSARYEQNLEEINKTLSGRYEQKVAQQEPAPQEPVIDDATFDKAPSKTAEMISKKVVAEELAEVGKYYGGIIGNLAEQTFETQLDSLRNERFFPYLEKDIRKFFEDNPQGKLTARSARTIYDQYVGQDIENLLQSEAEAKEKNSQAQDDLVHQRVVRPDVRDQSLSRTPAPRGPVVPQNTGAQLTENERHIFEIYRRYKVFDDEEDWRNWSNTLGVNPRHDIPGDYAEGGKR